jgi:hypothetical protein
MGSTGSPEVGQVWELSFGGDDLHPSLLTSVVDGPPGLRFCVLDLFTGRDEVADLRRWADPVPSLVGRRLL